MFPDSETKSEFRAVVDSVFVSCVPAPVCNWQLGAFGLGSRSPGPGVLADLEPPAIPDPWLKVPGKAISLCLGLGELSVGWF